MNYLRSLPRDRQLMLAAGLCLVLLLGDRYVVSPLSARWQASQLRIDEATLAIAQDSRIVGQRAKWEAWEREAQAERLPAVRSDAENTLITDVDGWARDSKLTLTSIRPRWQTEKDGTAHLELHIGGSGSLGAVAAFLYAAETAPRAIAVDNLELSSRADNGQEIALSLRMSAISSQQSEVRP